MRLAGNYNDNNGDTPASGTKHLNFKFLTS